MPIFISRPNPLKLFVGNKMRPFCFQLLQVAKRISATHVVAPTDASKRPGTEKLHDDPLIGSAQLFSLLDLEFYSPYCTPGCTHLQ